MNHAPKFVFPAFRTLTDRFVIHGLKFFEPVGTGIAFIFVSRHFIFLSQKEGL